MEYVRLDGKGSAITTRAGPRYNAIVPLKLDLAAATRKTRLPSKADVKRRPLCLYFGGSHMEQATRSEYEAAEETGQLATSLGRV